MRKEEGLKVKKRIGLITLSIAFALVLLGVGAAQAATITASEQFAGTVQNNAGTPNTWTSLTFDPANTVTYGATGDFASGGSSPVISSPIPIQNNLSANLNNLLTWKVGGNNVSFSAKSEQILSQTAGTLTLYFLGYTTDPGAGYSSSYSSLTWSIAYNSGSSSSSWSATWSSPPTPPTNTPEPASMVLFGLGLGMMGYFAYRRPGQPIGLV
jgi:hypothetical protein